MHRKLIVTRSTPKMGKKQTKKSGKQTKISQVKRAFIKKGKGKKVEKQVAVKHGKVKKKIGTKNVGMFGKPVNRTGARYAHEAAQKAGVGYKSKKRPKEEEQKENEELNEQEDENIESEEEDVAEDFEDDDLDYIKTMTGSGFLSGVHEEEEESEQQDAGKSRSKKKHQDNIPAPYEMKPRHIDADPRRGMKALLPIKHSDKGLEYRWEEKRRMHEEDQDETAEDEDEKPAASLPTITMEELLEQRRMKLTKKRQRIATLGSAVQADPEKNIFKLKELVAMLRENDPDLRVTLRKLAMVTLCEIFKDIAPGYRIKEYGEYEEDIQYKKETKSKRTFETLMLKHYRRYLEFLEETINEIKKTKRQERKERLKEEEGEEEDVPENVEIPKDARIALAELATTCMCSLLNNLFHFNYRTNIISVVSSLTVNKMENVSDQCCQCIRQLFRDDFVGEAAVDAVRFITRLAKARHYEIHPKVLETFLSLKIKETNLNNPDLEKRKALEEKKNKMRRLSRSQRRFQKRMDRLNIELQATEASENKKRKLKMHTEIIQAVFATYFRILKMETTSRLLPSVLEGLAKFAHLINVEFFDDLVKALHHLIDLGTLGHRESLHCVLTAFSILSGQGDVLNIDPTKFYTHFYMTLLNVNAGASSDDVSIILECLDAMIHKRHKQVSIQRILAYLKRLSTLSIQSLPNASLSYLCSVRNIMKRHPKGDALLDTESSGSGVFMPELDQPEHCSAHNTSLWELAILKRHYHPVVQTYAHHLSRGFPYTGAGALDVDMARKTPQHFLEEYDPSEMQFNPPLPPKSSQVTKKAAKLQLISMSDGHFIQEDFQSLVSNTVQQDTINCIGIDFANQAQQLRTSSGDDNDELEKFNGLAEKILAKNKSEQSGDLTISSKVVAADHKRKGNKVMGPRSKKFKGQGQEGIQRSRGNGVKVQKFKGNVKKGIIRANGK